MARKTNTSTLSKKDGCGHNISKELSEDLAALDTHIEAANQEIEQLKASITRYADAHQQPTTLNVLEGR